ncbi:hypothetical protein BRADI_2g25545v3 [Brachypodium distachyon]|uniref:Uncharacterized protein n=1 Tax=Brachypodium distachyon TaxID=15368 RepID=A0A2K2DAG4_BRADI|nr:hypothetical protein BRADI_2g25545v3 [Brachypodium distachyon]
MCSSTLLYSVLAKLKYIRSCMAGSAGCTPGCRHGRHARVRAAPRGTSSHTSYRRASIRTLYPDANCSATSAYSTVQPR